MWLAPALAAVAIAGGGWLHWAIFLAAALALFLARNPMALRVRGVPLGSAQTVWLAAYLAVGLALGAVLVFAYDRWLLVPLGLVATFWLGVHLLLAMARRDRSVAGQWVGVAGLTLAGPAAYYVATGDLGSTGLALWALSFLYFGYPIYYVKFKVDPATRKADPDESGWQKLRLGRQPILYQAFSVALAALLAAFGVAPWAALAALAPATVQVVVGVLRPSPRLSMKRLGFTQVGHSLAFGVLLALAFRL